MVNRRAAPSTVLKSVCRSCHGGCGALLHVQDGVLIKVEGDPASPLNRGRLCPDRHDDARSRLPSGPSEVSSAPGGRAGIGTVGAHFLGRGARRDFDAPSRHPQGIRRRGDRARNRDRPASHPLGLALRPCARHAELVRAGFRPVLPSAGQHLPPDLRRFSGLRLHRRRTAALHSLLGSQSAQLGSRWRDPLRRARCPCQWPQDHRRGSARHGARAKCRCLATGEARRR